MPVFDWGRRYDRDALGNDLVAAVIVTIMLIPQSLAYALLAGLPPEAGIYASIAADRPLRDLRHLSRALAVGPVAVVSLMTAAAVGKVAIKAPRTAAGRAHAGLPVGRLPDPAGRGLPAGLSRQFPLHPVIAGFITASGILIAFSQLPSISSASPAGQRCRRSSTRCSSIWATSTRSHLPSASRHRVPVLGPQGAETVPHRARHGPKAADVAPRPGRWCGGRHHGIGLGPWPLPTAAWPSWARCRNRCRR
jgi:SulP family sulfate permease